MNSMITYQQRIVITFITTDRIRPRKANNVISISSRFLILYM